MEGLRLASGACQGPIGRRMALTGPDPRNDWRTPTRAERCPCRLGRFLYPMINVQCLRRAHEVLLRRNTAQRLLWTAPLPKCYKLRDSIAGGRRSRGERATLFARANPRDGART